MRKFYHGILFCILASLSLYLTSCALGSCLDETEAKVKGTFYSMETKKAVPPDSVTLYGINMDTLKIYNKSESLKSVEFPLYAAETDRKLVLRINGINDTLEFTYSSYTQLLSKECGYTFFYNLDTVIYSRNIIDSISTVKKTITTFNEENMRIFY
jgi:predicted nucleic-acid-binding Zn-ribbon protein